MAEHESQGISGIIPTEKQMTGKIPLKIQKLNKEGLKRLVLKERKKYVPQIPSYISKRFQVDEIVENGCKCYRILPTEGFNGTYIVYLYGGYMCMNITAAQWNFIYHVCESTGTGLFVPMYPLAPEYSCRELFKMLKKTYSNFVKGFDVNKVILMGDEYGAGLALSICMLAWEEGFRKPDKLILISPALDTEFFDEELEKSLSEPGVDKKFTFYNENVKDFLNSYWVKDYAVKTQYTSPFYGDYMDLCDDVVIFSGDRDIHSKYTKEFYNKAKKQRVNVRMFLFEGGGNNFIINTANPLQKEAFTYLTDVINDTCIASYKDLYPVKVMSYWNKIDPSIIQDPILEQVSKEKKYNIDNIKFKLNEYRKLLLISRIRACDAAARQFIMKYPDCTIIDVGCRLNNMFQRVDNGRINWYSVDTYNTISVRRTLFGENEREKTIGRSIMDFSWLEEISCKRNYGVMFIFGNTLSMLKGYQIKQLMSQIRFKFPSAEVLFTATSTDATIYHNIVLRHKAWSGGKINMSIDDAQKTVYGWRTDYRIMDETPVMKYRPKVKYKKIRTGIAVKYNLITNNHKLLHLKLGREEYDVNV